MIGQLQGRWLQLLSGFHSIISKAVLFGTRSPLTAPLAPCLTIDSGWMADFDYLTEERCPTFHNARRALKSHNSQHLAG